MNHRMAIPLPDSSLRLGLLLMLVKTLLGASNIIPLSDGLDDCLALLAVGWLAVSVLHGGLRVWMLLALGAFSALGLLTAVKTGSLSILLTGITCFAFCREDFDESLYFLLFWEGLVVLLHIAASVLLAALGVPMMTLVGGVPRFNFGFSHPNVFSILLLNLLVMWLWLRFDALAWYHPVIIGAVICFFYLFTDTRALLLAGAALILLLALRRRQGLLRFGASVCVPAVGILEFLLWKLYTAGNAAVRALDEVLSSRIKLGAYALDRFGLTLLGQDLRDITVTWSEEWGLGSFTFDDVYSYLTVYFGLVWLAVIAVLFYRVARKGTARHWIFIIIWALYGVAETHVINPYMFFPILMVAALAEREEGL